MSNEKATYGLVGYPVEHSLSPFMHNTAFKALKVPAVYKLFPLKEEELDGFFTKLKDEASPIFGLNVTVPYKEKAVRFMDSLSPFAEKVGAVNTVVISNNRKLTGHNTDGPGFLAHLAELGVDTTKKRIVVLGSGGAARSLVSALCLIPEKPESIRIFDVDQLKAHTLLKDLKESLDVNIVEAVPDYDDLNIELCDILINATPVGLKPTDPCLVDPGLLHKRMLVYDLIYNPAETALLRAAREKGAKTANGLGMLFYQGVLAFQHWAEIELEETVKSKMRRSLEEKKVL